MLKGGFFKNVFQKIDQLITGRGPVTAALYDELEESLIAADLNVHTSLRLIEDLRAAVRSENLTTAEDVKDKLRDLLIQSLLEGEGNFSPLKIASVAPSVYLIVGVNGVGKTTSIAKLAYRFKQQGKKVILAAADTFRAAAIDQVVIWGERIGVDVVRGNPGGDPASVVYDALQAARARQADYVICDTANRVLMRERDGAPADETLLVLDATTGQNAISQAKEFKQAVAISGLILAKLDSTARGGIVITIKEELKVPIKLIGTGERPEDLEAFEPHTFVKSIFG
jgi:fused signal recognition particle receptor